MKISATEDTLELKVKNFGPIIDAEVDLRPLTVFIGPSNTGKSYLAILIYALHQFFGSGAGYLGRHFLGRSTLFWGREAEYLSPDTTEQLFNLARSLDDVSSAPDAHTLRLPPRVADALQVRLDENAEALGSEFVRCFGLDEIAALTRKGHPGGARIVMRRRAVSDSNPIEHVLKLSPKTELKTKIPVDSPISIKHGIGGVSNLYMRQMLSSLDEDRTTLAAVPAGGKERVYRRQSAASNFLASLGDAVLPSLIGPLSLPAYYLPSDRTGIMHAHSVVVSALIARAPAAGLRPAVRTPMLSGVLADFLEQLIGIDQISVRRRKAGHDLGKNIEKDILGGKILIERSAHIDYPRFAYRPYGWRKNLALANASSMVSELAPVVLYLRHMTEPGSVLIVEEPESHLHPAMQVAFTRQLAAIVEAGVRVIVTTHSEWLLEELANIVQRSRLPDAARAGNTVLRPDQVGIWLFETKQRPKGSIIREITLEDSGLYPSGYDEVASALHNEWADIESRIEAGS